MDIPTAEWKTMPIEDHTMEVDLDFYVEVKKVEN